MVRDRCTYIAATLRALLFPPPEVVAGSGRPPSCGAAGPGRAPLCPLESTPSLCRQLGLQVGGQLVQELERVEVVGTGDAVRAVGAASAQRQTGADWIRR